MSILVSGSLAYDRIMDYQGYFKDAILPDKIHVLNVSFNISSIKENFGGTAGNIAYNLALLGERPIVLATAGRDFGKYKAWLEKHNVDVSLIEEVDDYTASAHIITDQADNQITGFHMGAMVKKFSIFNFQFSIKNAKLAIIAPGNIDDMRELPGLFRENNIPFIFDPGQAVPALSGDDLINGLTDAKVFISNDYELELVLQKTSMKKQDLLEKAEIVVTTLGEKGSIVETKDGIAQIPPAKPDNASDPTGAGDAFRAGFIKGLLNRWPLEKAGKLGSVVSVYTVEKYGTQTHQFTWEELVERYRNNFGESL